MAKTLFQLISICWVGICLLLPAHSQQNQEVMPEVGYSFNLRWRLGAPVFIQEEFPTPVRFQHQPTLFVGGMAPRGSFILDQSGNLATTPAEQRRVFRSDTVDITSLITIAGASHRDADGKITNYTADQLPKLKVIYEPELPAEIVLPNAVGTVVLLWQIGEGKENEWAEGYWSVTLRFDARPLRVELSPHGSGAFRDPAFGQINSVVLFPFGFHAKNVETEDDRLNLLLFQFYDNKGKGQYQEALAALNPILEKYPNDGPLLLQRSELNANYLNDLQAALADARQLLKLTQENKLRRMFRPPLFDRFTTREDAVGWLKRHIKFLEGRAAGTLTFPSD